MKFLSLFLVLLLSQPVFALTATTPLALSISATSNSQPIIDENDAGYALAVWTTGLAPSQTISAASFSPLTGVWSTPVTLGIGNSPQVGIDILNHGVAVWVNNTITTNGSSQIQGSYFNGSVWNTAVTISTITPALTSAVQVGTANFSPSLAVSAGTGAPGSTTRALVAWVNQFPPLIFAASFNGSSPLVWSTPTQVSVTNGVLPSVGIRATGAGIVIWQDLATAAILQSTLTP